MQAKEESLPIVRARAHSRGALLAAGLCLAIGVAAGYLAGSFRTKSRLALSTRVPFEYYLAEQSFSEVDNAKARLDAICTEFVTDLRAGSQAIGSKPHPWRTSESGLVDDMIRALREGMRQFEGTEQQLHLINELLYLLKKQPCGDRWLDLYLATLYRHPTSGMVTRSKGTAVAFGEALGRQEEVARAMNFLGSIPARFSAQGWSKIAFSNGLEPSLGGPPGGKLTSIDGKPTE